MYREANQKNQSRRFFFFRLFFYQNNRKENNFFTVLFFEGKKQLNYNESEKLFEKIGEIPLPPYVKEKEIEEEKYQTIYNKKIGSAAAPTAGLHFNDEIYSKLKEKGIQFVFVDLQIGLGTFQPIKVEKLSQHKMHRESYSLSKDTVTILNDAKKNKKRIIAVGTTSLRAIEDNFSKNNEKFISGEYQTNLFLKPENPPKSIDGILTNFHLPKSTLFILICSIVGTEEAKKIYNIAVKENYRFFSFGDAMLIL